MASLDAGRVIAALRGAFAREVGRTELLRLAAERIRAAGAPYTSVYLYMLQGEELVLEAFAGRETDHTRIPVGKGVCGTAVATGRDQNVPDVRAVENYIACNTWTRSELVVLIRRGRHDPRPDRRGQRRARSLHARGRGRGAQGGGGAGGPALGERRGRAGVVSSPYAGCRSSFAGSARGLRRSCSTAAPARTTTTSCPASTRWPSGGSSSTTISAAAGGRRCRVTSRSAGPSRWPTSRRCASAGRSTASPSPDTPGAPSSRCSTRSTIRERVERLALISPAPAWRAARDSYEARFSQRNLDPGLPGRAPAPSGERSSRARPGGVPAAHLRAFGRGLLPRSRDGPAT